jgi:mannose-6-phosphate isomerase-like protein (cupin superfamily)
MYVTSVDRVEECEMNVKGARGVKVKYLLHERVGAKRLQLRLFTIDVSGYTPLEKHKHEHEVFILQGKALVRGGDVEVIVKEGDVIFISSWERHQFRNMGEEKLQFLCTKETIE